MNELEPKKDNLPDTPQDLAKFVIVGREKLKAVKAEISAIEKVGLANEVHEQKLKEAQEIGETVLLSEQRLGELLKEIPKATPNNNPFHESDSGVGLVNSKTNSVTNLGIPERKAQRYQQLAKHPDAVTQAIDRAKENDSIVTRQDALDIIYEDKRAKEKQVKREAEKAYEQKKKSVENDDIVNLADVKEVKDESNKREHDEAVKQYVKFFDAISKIPFVTGDELEQIARVDMERPTLSVAGQCINASVKLERYASVIRRIQNEH